PVDDGQARPCRCPGRRRVVELAAQPANEEARMVTRREYLKLSAVAGVALAISPKLLLADDSPRALVTRAIPGTSEQLPVVGLGSSASFSRIAGEGDAARIREVLETLVRQGGSVFDTAPSYGASEEVAGRVVQEAGLGRSEEHTSELQSRENLVCR